MMVSSAAWSISVTKSLRCLRATLSVSRSRLARLMIRAARRAAVTATFSIGCMNEETLAVFLSAIRHCKGSKLSTLHQSAPPWFAQTAFVLVRPSHPGNVGAVARAMRTMGLRRLVVVDPREPQVLAHPEAIARASGAHDLLAEAQLAPSLEAALAPFTLAVA